MIVALLMATTLGDFIEYNIFAAAFKRQYRNAVLIAYYHRDRSFKDQVVAMNPEIDEVWARNGKEPLHAARFDVPPWEDFDAANNTNGTNY